MKIWQKDVKIANRVQFLQSELLSSTGQPADVLSSLPSFPCRPQQLLLIYKDNEICQIDLIDH